MSRLSHSTETLGQETKGYIDSQLDLVKLRSIKGLSQGTSAIVGLLLIFLIAGALMTVLLLALVLWLGEILNSYALASLIVAGVLLVLLVLLFARRRYLFRNSFVSMYTDVFFPEEAWPAGLDSMDSLDKAIDRTESRIRKEKAGISNLLFNGFRWTSWIIPVLRFLFKKLRK